MEPYPFQEPHPRGLLAAIGLADVSTIEIDGA
jgi:hypothetical protein